MTSGILVKAPVASSTAVRWPEYDPTKIVPLPADGPCAERVAANSQSVASAKDHRRVMRRILSWNAGPIRVGRGFC